MPKWLTALWGLLEDLWVTVVKEKDVGPVIQTYPAPKPSTVTPANTSSTSWPIPPEAVLTDALSFVSGISVATLQNGLAVIKAFPVADIKKVLADHGKSPTDDLTLGSDVALAIGKLAALPSATAIGEALGALAFLTKAAGVGDFIPPSTPGYQTPMHGGRPSSQVP